MSTTFPTSVEQQRRINNRTFAALYVGLLATCAVLGVLTLNAAPRPLGLPMTMLVLAGVTVALRPVVGVYLTAFFMLFTDSTISPWYPFAKNLSSRESIMFLADGIIITPFEILLGITFVAWLLHLLIDRRGTAFVRGGLLTPVMVFTGFVVMGFMVGEATNGNRYVAVWEARPLFYLPIAYVVVTNLLTSRRAYYWLGGVMCVAWLSHAVLALDSWSGMSPSEREQLQSLVDHPAAVQMAVMLFVAIAAWMVPKVPGVVRLLLLVAAIPVGWAWMVSERRSAMIGLAVGLVVLGVVMVRLNPRRLKMVAPIALLVGVAYLGAFWSSTGPAAFPAQSIKSVIAPAETSLEDQNSNLYRQLENINLVATIEARPLTGMGFGQKFLRPVPLADISWFAFYEYMPHNSLLWIWIKMGVGGFVATLFLFGATIRSGVRSVLRLRAWPDVLLTLAATVYVVMYLVFAYVDIAWDTRSMVCLAIAMAICSELVRLPPGRHETM